MTYPTTRKKRLSPLVTRIAGLRAAFDAVDPACECRDTARQASCPAEPQVCRAIVAASTRVHLNVLGWPHRLLTDTEVEDLIRDADEHLATVHTSPDELAFALALHRIVHRTAPEEP